MKTFRYPKGHLAGEALTVGELKEILSSHPEDMPVLATWEGCLVFVNKTEVDDITHYHEDDNCKCLIIDADDY